MIRIPKKGECVCYTMKPYVSPFMIYADFESILLPEDNEKQNLEEFCSNKYKKHVACSYGYKLIYTEVN